MIGKALISRRIYFAAFILVVNLTACELESTKYSPVPQIEFLESSSSIITYALGQKTIVVQIQFYLIDGDGDVGPTPSDINEPDKSNFFPTLYGIVNGKVIKDTTVIADEYRIPYVGDLGQDMALKAKVSIDFEYPYTEQFPFPYDSVFYSFYMVDRALNLSNVVFTDTIITPK